MSKDKPETEDEIIASETAARHLWHKGVPVAKALNLPCVTIDGVTLTPAGVIALRAAIQVIIAHYEDGPLGALSTIGTLRQINNLLSNGIDDGQD